MKYTKYVLQKNVFNKVPLENILYAVIGIGSLILFVAAIVLIIPGVFDAFNTSIASNVELTGFVDSNMILNLLIIAIPLMVGLMLMRLIIDGPGGYVL